MPISYPISLPTVGTQQVHLKQTSVVGVGIDPFSLVTQVQEFDGQVWELTLNYPPMKRETAAALVAALMSLNGRGGTFLIGDTSTKVPRGVATGTPLVKGGSQVGEDLVTDGWTAGVTGILKADDWIQLGSGSTARLHKVLVDANSNGSGEATLTLWPSISQAAVPADNSAIVTSFPKGVFMLTTDGIDYDVNVAHLRGLSVSAISLP